MVTHTNQLDRKDNTALWTVMAIIVVAALAYAAYTAYHNGYNGSVNTTESGNRNQTNTQ